MPDELTTPAIQRMVRDARAAAPPRLDDDQWVSIPGFGDAYELHRDGRVRSWKVWRGSELTLPRAMKVQVLRGRRKIQLGLHGGTHDVGELVAQLFATKIKEEQDV